MATGRLMTALWRAPFGEVNDELLRWAAAAGWSHVGWTRDDSGGRHTLDSLDWVAERSSRNYLTSEQIAARILSFGAGGAGLNGGIVLMHLSTNREDPGVTRLGELIDSLRESGYSPGRRHGSSARPRPAGRPGGAHGGGQHPLILPAGREDKSFPVAPRRRGLTVHPYLVRLMVVSSGEESFRMTVRRGRTAR